MQKVILDVDTGIDDAMAILLAAESGKLNILGITTVNGNVPLDMVITNTKKVLKLQGNEHVKVYRGASQPLIKPAMHEFAVHGNDGLGGALKDMPVDQGEEDTFAPDYIIEQAKRFPGELTLIVTGPQTNVALALRKEPRLAEWVKQCVIMGGLVSEAGKGNTLPTSEFNIFADAEAAKIVFHSGMPITLVSLDVTMKTFLTRDIIERLKGTRYYDFILQSTEQYRNYSLKNYGRDGSALHDPLTVGVVLDPSLVTTARHFVDVETKSELSYGQTICDFRNNWKKEPNVAICLDVDADRFIDMFIEVLGEK